MTLDGTLLRQSLAKFLGQLGQKSNCYRTDVTQPTTGGE